MEQVALAVLGTLGGAIVGALAALATEGRRERHEDDSRWHAERFQHYAKVLRAADDYIASMRRYATHVQALGRMGTEASSDRWPEVPDRRPMDQACREAELVASWRGLTYPLLKLLRGSAAQSPEPANFWEEPVTDTELWDVWLETVGVI